MSDLFFYTHLGLGDAVWCNGAIRFLSSRFKKIKVVCLSEYELQIKLMFSDLNNIETVPVKKASNRWFDFPEANNCSICTSGGYVTHKESASLDLYPDCFYDDIGISRDIRITHFHVPNPEDACVPPTQKYIFIQSQSTAGNIDIFSKLNTNILVIDPNTNHYSVDHEFYDQAESFLRKPSIFHYMDVIKNAEEIHIIDSSFGCLAAQLDLSKVKRKVCHWVRSKCIENLKIFEITS
jgi:hypothetical protein